MTEAGAHPRMLTGEPPGPGGPPPDARLRGFADRVSFADALAWVDRVAARLVAVEVDVAEAAGRVPVAPVAAPRDLPEADRAGEDGWAVRAADVVGATAWGPAPLRVQDASVPLAPASAALVAAGTAMPPGADAVVPFDAAERSGAAVDVLGAVPAGSGVERAGRQLRTGTAVADANRPLRPHHAALLAEAGVARVSVVRRPRVRLVVAGPKPAGPDAHVPMLRPLVERDGGEVEVARGALADALPRGTAEGVDLVLATGRSGTGPDDDAPEAIARAGELAIHGIALRPGGSAALGQVRGCPVVLLPGDPLACLCAYELLAGRLVRRLAGRDPALPHAARDVEAGRKIASSVGLVEVVPVRLAGGRAEPLGVADFGGLAAAARSAGFVVVPAAVEGYAEGAPVTVYAWGRAEEPGCRPTT